MSAFHIGANHPTELYVLTAVTKTLITPLELAELLEAVMDTIAEALEAAEFGMVWLWDPLTGLFRPQALCGPDFPKLQKLRQLALREGESVVGKVYNEGIPSVFSTPDDVAKAMSDLQPVNAETWNQGLSSDELPYSMIAVPLWAGGQKYGVLMLGTLYSNNSFVITDIPFIQI